MSALGASTAPDHAFIEVPIAMKMVWRESVVREDLHVSTVLADEQGIAVVC